MKHFYTVLFTIWAVLILPCRSSALPKTKIDSLAQAFLKSSGSSCVVIGIEDHGKETIYSYGYLDKDHAVAADSATIFEIGSITKVFTALAMAKDEHAGLLKYSDKISQFYSPSVKIPSYKGHYITISDLLHHTSALPRIPDNLINSNNKDETDPYAAYTRKNMEKFLRKCKLERAPGEKYDYSNTGFGIAGDILSRIHAESYEKVVKSNVLMPLGMTGTGLTLNSNQEKRFASPYNEKGQPDHHWNFDAMAGCGALRADMHDMMLFLRASIRPESIKDSDLRSAMQQSQALLINAGGMLQVGLAWHVSPLDYGKMYWHNGGTGGFRSFMGFTSDRHKGVVVLTNSATSADALGVSILHDMDMESR